MKNSGTYQFRTVIFSVVLVILTSVLISCIFPALNVLSDNFAQKALIENVETGSGEENEGQEGKEFSEKILFSSDFRPAKFNGTGYFTVAVKYTCMVPQVSLDIPVPPPKDFLS